MIDWQKEVLESIGAIKYGNFILSSGISSNFYIEKFRILERPGLLERMCKPIADFYYNIDVVIGPSTGGMFVAYEVARQMNCTAIYAELDEYSERTITQRGSVLKPGSKVLLVDDILTTGESIKTLFPLIEKAGCSVVGVGVLVDRSTTEIDFGCNLFATCVYKENEL